MALVMLTSSPVWAVEPVIDTDKTGPESELAVGGSSSDVSVTDEDALDAPEASESDDVKPVGKDEVPANKDEEAEKTENGAESMDESLPDPVVTESDDASEAIEEQTADKDEVQAEDKAEEEADDPGSSAFAAAPAGSNDTPIEKEGKPEKPVKGVTSNGWEYEYLELDDYSEGVEPGEYLLLKSFRGVCNNINVPSQITVKAARSDNTEYDVTYKTLVRGGKNDRTKFPAEATKITFDNGTATTKDISYLFSGYKQLEVVDITGLDFSETVNMSNLFSGCAKLTEVEGSLGVRAPKATDLSMLFANCPSIGRINTGLWQCQPTDITSMLQGCSNACYIDMHTWIFSGVTANKSKKAFSGTSSLRTIWTPMYIPSDFQIPLAGTYRIWESLEVRSSYPKTTVLAPQGMGKYYLLSKIPKTGKDDDDDDSEETKPGDKPVSGVVLSSGHEVLEHRKGRPAKRLVSAAVLPGDATNRDVIWSTTDKKVVTVTPMDDGDALITTKGPGFADVTVTTVDGGFSETCNVTVKCYSDYFEETRGDEDSIYGGTPDFEFVAGQSYDLYEYLDNMGVFNPKKNEKCVTDFSIDSTNPNAVSASSSGMLTTREAGLAFLGVKYKHDKKPVQRTITGTKIRVWKPKFFAKTVTLSYIGQSFNGTDNIIYNSCPIAPSSWSSSKPNVASVDESGRIVAGKEGTAKIEARWTNDQGDSAAYSFSVKVKVPKISKTQLKLKTGELTKLKVNNIEKDKQVVWKLTDTELTGRDVNYLEDGSGDVANIRFDNLGHSCEVYGALPGTVLVTAVIDGEEYDCSVEVIRPTIEFSKKGVFEVKQTLFPKGYFTFVSTNPYLVEVDPETGEGYKGKSFPEIDGYCTIKACYLNNEGVAQIVLPCNVRAYVAEGKRGPIERIKRVD
ncbi:MAG: Ig-like domain-containing protein [Lachnospiraceae bacterium]|nr:Ig-like domain-containing protein [Lachnospiraceae bacterium]